MGRPGLPPGRYFWSLPLKRLSGKKYSGRNCRQLLVSIYGLLSRVSLHAHYTDRERATSMRELGFVLVPSQSGPIPDANDVVTLGVLIAAVVFFPLSYQVTTPRAILISVEVYVAIIAPILLAARLPLLARAQPNGTPGLAFPVLAGLIATAVGLVAHVLVLSIGHDAVEVAAAPWTSALRPHRARGRGG